MRKKTEETYDSWTVGGILEDILTALRGVSPCPCCGVAWKMNLPDHDGIITRTLVHTADCPVSRAGALGFKCRDWENG